MAPKTERYELRLDEDVLLHIDEWRKKNESAPTRAEAIRQLIDLGLSVAHEKSIRLSDGEKLLTLMMRDLYRHLGVKGEVNADFMSEVIYGGHYWAPRWDMQGIFHDAVDRPRDVRFVADVLDMWSFIEEGFADLGVADVKKVETEAHPFGTNPKFSGFDGNTETDHMGIARFLIEHMGRFPRFKDRGLNAHMPTLAGYSRMLAVFEPFRAKLIGRRLTADEVVSILNARRYPD